MGDNKEGGSAGAYAAWETTTLIACFATAVDPVADRRRGRE